MNFAPGLPVIFKLCRFITFLDLELRRIVQLRIALPYRWDLFLISYFNAGIDSEFAIVEAVITCIKDREEGQCRRCT
jgi:hypothetical protein